MMFKKNHRDELAVLFLVTVAQLIFLLCLRCIWKKSIRNYYTLIVKEDEL